MIDIPKTYYFSLSSPDVSPGRWCTQFIGYPLDEYLCTSLGIGNPRRYLDFDIHHAHGRAKPKLHGVSYALKVFLIVD